MNQKLNSKRQLVNKYSVKSERQNEEDVIVREMNQSRRIENKKTEGNSKEREREKKINEYTERGTLRLPKSRQWNTEHRNTEHFTRNRGIQRNLPKTEEQRETYQKLNTETYQKQNTEKFTKNRRT